MKKNLIIVFVLLCGATAVPLQLQADPSWMWDGQGAGGGGCNMHGPGMMGRGMGMGLGFGGMGPMMGGLAMLGLSEQQLDRITDIQTRLQKDHLKLMGEMIDAQADVRKAWNADRPDPRKVGTAYARMNDLERRAIEDRVAARNKIYDTLTDEQREMLKAGPYGMWGRQGGRHMGRGHMMMQ